MRTWRRCAVSSKTVRIRVSRPVSVVVHAVIPESVPGHEDELSVGIFGGLCGAARGSQPFDTHALAEGSYKNDLHADLPVSSVGDFSKHLVHPSLRHTVPEERRPHIFPKRNVLERYQFTAGLRKLPIAIKQLFSDLFRAFVNFPAFLKKLCR